MTTYRARCPECDVEVDLRVHQCGRSDRDEPPAGTVQRRGSPRGGDPVDGYQVWTWGANPHPRNRHATLGRLITTFTTYGAASEYAATHAPEYDGGLYVMLPSGAVDTGAALVHPDGTIEED